MTMQGSELRDLRQSAGLSQSQLAGAIGMSRETIGLMERGEAPIEKRTELAVRYVISERGPQPPSQEMLIEEVENHFSHGTRISDFPETFFLGWVNALKRSRANWIQAEGSELGRVLLDAACLRAEMTFLKVGDRTELQKHLEKDFQRLEAAWGLVTPINPKFMFDLSKKPKGRAQF